MSFRDDFLWGASTAAYQIEGGWDSDGKGPSIWDWWSRRPGNIAGGASGDVACDHYHRWAEDVALMRAIGLNAYRFSIAWPRVLPHGVGAINQAGLDFYDRLVDALLQAGIRPVPTLYHWDLPLALYERGGWRNRDSADWFAAYADAVTRRLSDRVRDWLTFNEMALTVNAGYRSGIAAPGERVPEQTAMQVLHHLLLAHGKGVQAMRAAARQPLRISLAHVCFSCFPASADPRDVAATRRAFFRAPRLDGVEPYNNAYLLDPIFKGAYPDDDLASLGADAPHIESGDMETIAQPLDFLGLNVYYGEAIRAGADEQSEIVTLDADSGMVNADGWPIRPQVIGWASRLLHERYGLPLLITENGMSNRDWVALDGQVHDPQRIDFMRRYLSELRRAATDGVPVLGYLHWSLLDNLEWGVGYGPRFGLIHVDRATLQRTLKDSAHWYGALIRSNGATL